MLLDFDSALLCVSECKVNAELERLSLIHVNSRHFHFNNIPSKNLNMVSFLVYLYCILKLTATVTLVKKK